ncbi:MAG: peptidoglycan DD-metalloendopeptidase family protein [Saprospiraceae bacterium]|nr:peptidoglycan DD-metalloendopeptidase family protein [Saprospiraceae bacterium]
MNKFTLKSIRINFLLHPQYRYIFHAICSSLFIPIGIILWYQLTSQTNPANKPKDSQIKEIQQAIDQTGQLIKQNKSEKNQLLKNLELYQSQISYRTELQNALTNELATTQNELKNLQEQNKSNVLKLQRFKEQYAVLVKNKIIHRITYNPMLTLFHPEDLDAKVLKWYLLEKLEKQRIQTLDSLKTWNQLYTKNFQKLKLELNTQDSLLKNIQSEELRLKQDLSSSGLLIKELDSKEANLNATLTNYKRKKEALTKWIEASVHELVKTKTSTSKTNQIKRMRYPMQSPTIISRFGKNMESGNKNLVIRNNGIDLQSQNPFVSAANPAEVVQIRKMPNQLYLLITKSDDNYIVYSNLNSVLLRNGERIESGTNIGQAAKNEQGFYELHFETWQGKTPTNPMKFLK